MEIQQIHQLLTRYNAGKATDQEKARLEEWYDQVEGNTPDLDEKQVVQLRDEIYQALMSRVNLSDEHLANTPPAPVRRLFPVLRWAAAILLLSLASWLFYFSKSDGEKLTSRNNTEIPGNIVPAGNLATLTLANGKTVILNQTGNGKIAEEGNTEIRKDADGKLAYHVGTTGPAATGDLNYNIITTPRGGTYMVVLPDGTKVWLNAASSLRFPAAFTTNERSVELTGEAYFEVVKNVAKPFLVKFSGQTVQVLGTHFNISDYSDEPIISTTLLEGSVRINNRLVLTPGQQLQVDKQGNDKLVKNADLDEAIAWKDGFFNFNESDIPTIMRQIARWYNVDIQYTSTVPTGHFNGKIPRKASLEYVFRILELNGIHCTANGRTITVQ
ncbi:MAG: FecR domain-containing protein [Chitinophagaceae bacterium]